jgi:hypothetical protein
LVWRVGYSGLFVKAGWGTLVPVFMADVVDVV